MIDFGANLYYVHNSMLTGLTPIMPQLQFLRSRELAHHLTVGATFAALQDTVRDIASQVSYQGSIIQNISDRFHNPQPKLSTSARIGGNSPTTNPSGRNERSTPLPSSQHTFQQTSQTTR